MGNDQKNTIKTFFIKMNISIVSEFWNVGELKKQSVVFRTPFGNNTPSYEGTDNEKQKYNLLVDLYWKIKGFNEYEGYFSTLEKKRILKCVLSNTGTTFDEDIDVKLILKKNCICYFEDIPIPKMNIIEEINKTKLVDILFIIKESESIEKYSNFLPMHYIDPMLSQISALSSKSAEEEYKTKKLI